MLHRISGLGVVLFLTLHVIDTSWAVFYPELYEEAIASYQSPLFTLGEFGLVACVVFHAYNGLRIVLFDFRPEWWKHQQRAAFIVLGATAITLVPTFILMFSHVLDHYSHDPFVLSLDRVILGQLPFAIGFAAAAIIALLLSAVVGLVVGKSQTKGRASNVERFWWSFMRISGVLIVPLVFGHLAMMHVLQGVFDLTTANSAIVGTTAVNESGTAVEFVASRWNLLVGGVAVWKIYDLVLLSLVTLHGFNGLRYVLTDYTAFSPLLKRAAIYVSVIGAATLLALGAGALIYSINDSAIAMAQEAQCKLGKVEDPALCGETSNQIDEIVRSVDQGS